MNEIGRKDLIVDNNLLNRGELAHDASELTKKSLK